MKRIEVNVRAGGKGAKKKLDPKGRRAVALHLMREMRKQSQVWVGAELAYVDVDHGDAHYDVIRFNGATMSRVFCILRDCVGMIQVGDTVIVRYYDNDPDKPYIKGLSSENTYPGVEDVTVFPITVALGTWLQWGGLWWFPFNNSPQHLLISVTEGDQVVLDPMTAEMNPFDPPSGLVLKTSHLADLDRGWELFKNGVSFQSHPSGGFPTGGISTGTSGDHTLFFIPSGVDTYPTLNVWTMTYYRLLENDPVATVSFNDVGALEGDSTGRDISQQFRGATMFPSTGGNVVAALVAHYTPADAGPDVEQPGHDKIRVVTAGFNIDDLQSSSNAPYDRGQVEGLFLDLSHEPTSITDTSNSSLHAVPDDWLTNGMFPNELVFEVFSGATLWIPLRPKFGEADTIRFVYTRRNTGTFVHNETFAGDGTTVTWPINVGVGDQNNGDTRLIESLVSIVSDEQGDFSGGATFTPYSVTVRSPLSNTDQLHVAVNVHEGASVEEFHNGNVADWAMDDPQDGVVSVETLENISGTTGNHPELVYLPDSFGHTVKVRYRFTAAGDVEDEYDVPEVSYNYIGPPPATGDYDIDKLKIYERHDVTLASRVLELNLAPKWRAALVDQGTGVAFPGRSIATDPSAQEHGFLFFDNLANCYTVVGPTGIAWRSRALTAEPAPTPPGVRFTFTPWPDDGLTQDKELLSLSPGGEFPTFFETPKRRNNPYLGCSVAGPYALQGSWNRVGGYYGDVEFLVRLWKRNAASRVWENLVSKSVRLLCADYSTTYPLRVLPAGLVSVYDGELTNDSIRNAAWPATRNRDAWLTMARWIVHDFELEGEDYGAYLQAHPNTVGWLDAGLTLTALTPATGSIKGSLTLRVDKTDMINRYVDPNELMAAELAQGFPGTALNVVLDKYFNNNPIYWPPASGSDPNPPYFGQIIYISSNRWGEHPGTGSYWFFDYKMTAIVDDPESQVIQYPGPPSPAQNDPVLWQSNDAQRVHKTASQALALDALNNAYTTLWMPTWMRNHDSATAALVKDGHFTSEYVFSALGDVQTYDPGGESRCTMYLRDGNVFGLATDTENGPHGTNALRDGLPSEVFDAFIFEFSIGPLTHVIGFRPYTLVGYDDAYDPPLPTWNFPECTFKVWWRNTQPNEGSVCGSPTTYTGQARCFELPTFFGFQCSPQPYSGLKIFPYTGTRQVNLDTSSPRKFLFKVHYDERSGRLEEVWRKEVTQYDSVQIFFFDPYDQDPRPDDGRVPYTLAAGRLVFLLWWNRRKYPEATAGDPTQYSITASFLETYENTDSAPERIHNLLIPFSDVETITDPPRRGMIHMHADVDADGREHATVWWRTGNPAFGVGLMTFHVATYHFQLELADPPDVKHYSWAGSQLGERLSMPAFFDPSSIHTAGLYLWQDSTMHLWRKNMA